MFGHTSLKMTVAGLAVAVVAMGCQVEDDNVMGPTPQPAPVQQQPVSVVNMYGPIELTLTADRATYERHETVYLEMMVRNTGHSAVRFNFITGQQHDFLADTHGGPIWRYSDGRHYSLVANHVTLQPGETWVREGNWDQRDNTGWEVPRGVYGMIGVIMHYSNNSDPIATDVLGITLR